MTEDNKQQKISDSTDTAIAYSTCYAQVFSRLFFGDCLIESDKIESGSVDLILTDLPYGTMEGQSKTGIYHNGKEKHEWDSIIDTDKIMQVANRILRPNGRMILFAQEPFTRELINKAIPSLPFSYRAIWIKDTLGSFMRSKSALLYRTEDILLFQKVAPKHDFEGIHPLRPYFKEVFEYIGHTKKTILEQVGQRADHVFRFNSSQFDLCTIETYEALIYFYCIDKIECFKNFVELKQIDTEYRTELLRQMNKQNPSVFNLWQGGKYKDNVFEYKRDRDNFHPTQKPILLLEDLIKTFSNEGNLVVDLTMGSGSTGVACKNTNRSFIGIEKDEAYFKIAEQRINARTLFF
jgi:DNA modification methylase